MKFDNIDDILSDSDDDLESANKKKILNKRKIDNFKNNGVFKGSYFESEFKNSPKIGQNKTNNPILEKICREENCLKNNEVDKREDKISFRKSIEEKISKSKIF
mgnify:CR=1 FL=1